jgi:hypothetical protein
VTGFKNHDAALFSRYQLPLDQISAGNSRPKGKPGEITGQIQSPDTETSLGFG